MRKIIRFAFGTVFFIFIIGAAVAAAQNYNVLILTPPAGFNETAGDGIRGSQRVGAARISDAPYPEQTHAFLWKGNLAIDLNPSGYMYSRAYDTDGVHQVGAAWLGGPGVPTIKGAGIWSGSADSFQPICDDMT